MGEPAGFDDWELLHSSDVALFLAPDLNDAPKSFHGIEGEPNGSGSLKPDYFALESGELYAKRASSGEGLTVCGNPSSVEHDSGSRRREPTKGELGLTGPELPHEDPGRFHSDKSSDGLISLPDCPKGEPFLVEDSKAEVGLEGFDARHRNSGENVASKEAVYGEAEKFTGSEPGGEKADTLGSGQSVRMEDSSGSSAGTGDGSAASENSSPREAEKRGMVLLKMPLDLLKFCALRVKPVWPISIAAAIVGILMLGRWLYRIRRKSRSIPFKVNIDDKKASQFMVRAARLNETFSVVRPVSIVRFPHPAGGVTPWPVVGLL